MAAAILTKARNIDRELESLVEGTKELPRAARISHERVTELSGIDKEEINVRGRLIAKWKKRLLELRGITVRSDHGLGYKYLTVDETLSDDRHDKSIGRSMNRKAKETGSISPTELDDTGLRLQAAIGAQVVELKYAHKTQRSEHRGWLSNAETLPKLPENGKKKIA